MKTSITGPHDPPYTNGGLMCAGASFGSGGGPGGRPRESVAFPMDCLGGAWGGA